MTAAPPRWARWLLRLWPLGSRRADIETDLFELFDARAAAQGIREARRRFAADVVSLCLRRQPARVDPSRRPRAPLGTGSWADVVYACRLFRRHAGFVSVAVGGLAMGIALSASVFSLLDALLLRPVGVEQPSSTFHVMNRTASGPSAGISTSWPYAAYLDLRARSAEAAIEASLLDGLIVRPQPDAGAPGRTIGAAFVSETFLATFGSRPAAGRLLTPDDGRPGAPLVAVASYGFWQRSLGGDKAVIGRPMSLSGARVTIVGVTDRAFTGPTLSDTPPALWLPLQAHTAIFGQLRFDPASHTPVEVWAVVRHNATRTRAEAQLSAVAASFTPESLPRDPARNTSGNANPATSRASGVRLDPIGLRFDGPDAGPLWASVGGVALVIALVLLLASTNVANLLLASAATRQTEIGIRLAVGASRWRVVRQLLTESLVLATVAGSAGWVITLWTLPALAAFIRAPETIDLAPDVRVYAFLAVAALVTGIIAGLAPARYGTRGDLVSPLEGSGESRGGRTAPTTIRATLVAAQAGASVLLLVLASLFVRALLHVSRIDTGVDVAHLLTVSTDLSSPGQSAATLEARWSDALERVRAVPGVTAASAGMYTPFGFAYGLTTASWHGVRLSIYTNTTRGDYFQTTGLRILRGRAFTDAEVHRDARVAVVSETLARDLWGEADPIGRTLDAIDRPSDRVVGVVADAVTADLMRQGRAALYTPLWPLKLVIAHMVVRTSGSPTDAERSVVAALQPLAPRGSIVATPIAESFDRQLDVPRILAGIAATFGVFALGLAIAGLHGVTAFVAHQRTREVGIRMAIGARPGDILRLLARDTLRPVAWGLAVGLVLALGVGRILAAVLSGISGTDPLAIVAAVVLLLTGAAAAIAAPVRRAARIDPARVLR